MPTTKVVNPTRRYSRLVRATVTVAVILCVLYLLEHFVGERFWIVTMLTYVPQHWALTLPLPMLLIALLRRRWKVALTNLALILFVVVALMGFCWTSKLRTPDPLLAPTIRVMTFNVCRGIFGMDNITATVNNYHPDIICINEVDVARKNPNPATYTALRRALPEYTFTPKNETIIGTRLPLAEVTIHPLSGAGMGRYTVRAVVATPQGKLTVIGTHLATLATAETLTHHKGTLPDYINRTANTRRAEIDGLLNLVAKEKEPVLLCGDLNTPPRGQLYSKITRIMDDSFAVHGFGFGHSYSATHPLLRIDYIFTAGGAKARSCDILAAHASDHLPVVAEVTMSERD